VRFFDITIIYFVHILYMILIGSGLQDIIKGLKIPDKLVKMTDAPKVPVKKRFNKFLPNLIRKKNKSLMFDLLELPTTKKGNKYLLVGVDLWSNHIDIEPMKTKTANAVYNALQAIFKRKHIKYDDLAQFNTDDGNEFKGKVKEFFRKIGNHKTAQPDRHQQQAPVENVNRIVGYILNMYMLKNEKEKGETYREWDEITDYVRTELNKKENRALRKDEDLQEPPDNWDSRFDETLKTDPEYKVGDIVYVRLDAPKDAVEKKKLHGKFRMGDMRFDDTPMRITGIVPFPSRSIPYRYLLEGKKRVSYAPWQLMTADEKEQKYDVKDLIDKRTHKKKLQYLVWWRGYKKSESTWQDRTELIKDGFQDYIDRYEEEQKAKAVKAKTKATTKKAVKMKLNEPVDKQANKVVENKRITRSMAKK